MTNVEAMKRLIKRLDEIVEAQKRIEQRLEIIEQSINKQGDNLPKKQSVAQSVKDK